MTRPRMPMPPGRWPAPGPGLGALYALLSWAEWPFWNAVWVAFVTAGLFWSIDQAFRWVWAKVYRWRIKRWWRAIIAQEMGRPGPDVIDL